MIDGGVRALGALVGGGGHGIRSVSAGKQFEVRVCRIGNDLIGLARKNLRSIVLGAGPALLEETSNKSPEAGYGRGHGR